MASNVARWSAVPPVPGQLLVAAPMLIEDTFARTVLYLLEHDDSGSAAVVLNRASRTPVGQVLPDWHDIASDPAVVFSGGPVQPDAALCLGWLTTAPQPADAAGPEGLDAGAGDDAEVGLRAAVRPVVDAICTVDLDSDPDVVRADARALRVFAGHAGWAPGQLDEELAAGAWFVVPGGPGDVFHAVPEQLRASVLRRQPPPLRLLATYPRDLALN